METAPLDGKLMRKSAKLTFHKQPALYEAFPLTRSQFARIRAFPQIMIGQQKASRSVDMKDMLANSAGSPMHGRSLASHSFTVR
ncbi:hypothetical protein HT136_25775 [Novosphingobium profundi]|uniref:hypothetical protein n=1 Tax=Novosphingobium profundi TaxID=1774954 RepID=UPI001BDAEE6D|nr:hypothetical protein [Novosphingobium profundi]MBT0671780.1 hypothetical protein [Novosphingobium profundi]